MHYFPFLTLLFLITGCTNPYSPNRTDTVTKLIGTVSYSQTETLPSHSKVHVILKEGRNQDAKSKIIAHQTIKTDGQKPPIPFELNFEPQDIDQDSVFVAQACITIQDKVQFASHIDVRVLTQGYADKADIWVYPVTSANSLLDTSSEIPEGETTLQQSIQTSLAGICRKHPSRYDMISLVKASTILSSEWISGSHHLVKEEVTIHGPHFFFVVDSDHGQFSAQGLAMLRRLVREINAVETMRSVSGTEAFQKALKETATIPFAEVKELLLNPVDTVTGVPKGITTTVQSTAMSVTKGRSNYEDRYFEAFFTISKYKRRYASELGIDVYSSNPTVQQELNRLGWAGAFGNWTPNTLLLPVTGPGKLAYSAFGWTKTFNRLVTEQAPDSLRKINDEALKTMGVSQDLRDKFLDHSFYSPRHQTITVNSLISMKNAKGRERFIQEAINAESEIDALTFQQIAELLAGFDRLETPIVEIVVHKRIPVGLGQNGTFMIGLPIDTGQWIPFTEFFFSDLDSTLANKNEVKKKLLWVTGELTPRMKRHLKIQGFMYAEHVGQLVGMMD